MTYCGHPVGSDADSQIVCGFCRRAYDSHASFTKHMYSMHNDLLKAREATPSPSGFWATSLSLWAWKVPANA